MLSLDGKVALVTGGGGGIGSAVVELFLAAGARVASVDLPGASCTEGAHAMPCDLRDRAAIGSLSDSTPRMFRPELRIEQPGLEVRGGPDAARVRWARREWWFEVG